MGDKALPPLGTRCRVERERYDVDESESDASSRCETAGEGAQMVKLLPWAVLGICCEGAPLGPPPPPPLEDEDEEEGGGARASE